MQIKRSHKICSNVLTDVSWSDIFQSEKIARELAVMQEWLMTLKMNS